MTRKKFLKRLFQLSIIGAFPALYSWQIEPFWLEFVHLNMSVKNLPKELEGKTIMQISDLHVGNRFDYQFLIDSFEEAKMHHPDFVVYAGDFVNVGNASELEKLEIVMQNAVLGKLGTFGILGNHDYGKNWKEEDVAQKVCEIAEKNGVQMLRNEKKEVNGLHFIGLDDLWSTNFDPSKIMKNHNENKANIVLCHNPDVCDLEVWNGYKGWILSGHTHGGQCRIPGIVTPILPVKNKRYRAGKMDLKDGRTLYINRAIGHSFQVRFMVRPEITIFKLSKSI